MEISGKSQFGLFPAVSYGPEKFVKLCKKNINPLTSGLLLDMYFKVLWEGVKYIFFLFGRPQQKVLKGQEFSGMGCLKIVRFVFQGLDLNPIFLPGGIRIQVNTTRTRNPVRHRQIIILELLVKRNLPEILFLEAGPSYAIPYSQE